MGVSAALGQGRLAVWRRRTHRRWEACWEQGRQRLRRRRIGQLVVGQLGCDEQEGWQCPRVPFSPCAIPRMRAPRVSRRGLKIVAALCGRGHHREPATPTPQGAAGRARLGWAPSCHAGNKQPRQVSADSSPRRTLRAAEGQSAAMAAYLSADLPAISSIRETVEELRLAVQIDVSTAELVTQRKQKNEALETRKKSIGERPAEIEKSATRAKTEHDRRGQEVLAAKANRVGLEARSGPSWRRRPLRQPPRPQQLVLSSRPRTASSASMPRPKPARARRPTRAPWTVSRQPWRR